ncbi:MAG TPA: hypothetical protein VNM72_09590 [Blastocatellia bacterium]|nr:hypothetical protein [Blastocatellia bacterium]
MTGLATYIYCDRFHESKSVLICAFRCPYWRGCKDWAGALAGEKKEMIVTEVTEYATRKGLAVNAEIWDPLGAAKRRRKRATAAPALTVPDSGARGTSSDAAQSVGRSGDGSPSRRTVRRASSEVHSPRGKHIMVNEEKLTERRHNLTPSPRDIGSRVKPAAKRKRTTARGTGRAKNPAASSTVYLILEKNGRYREVKSEEEMKRIALEIAGKGKKGVRFARATLLEAEVTFRPAR